MSHTENLPAVMVRRSRGSGSVKRSVAPDGDALSPDRPIVCRKKARGTKKVGSVEPRQNASLFGKAATPVEFDRPKPRVTVASTTTSAPRHNRRPTRRSEERVFRAFAAGAKLPSPR